MGTDVGKSLTPEGRMVIEQFRDKIVAKAIKSVHEHETKEHRKRGCLEGLEIVERLTTPEDFKEVLEIRHNYERGVVDGKTHMSEDRYWEYRCATAQIEYVYNILLVGWVQSGIVEASPLSCQSILRYAEFYQVRDDAVSE